MAKSRASKTSTSAVSPKNEADAPAKPKVAQKKVAEKPPQKKSVGEGKSKPKNTKSTSETTPKKRATTQQKVAPAPSVPDKETPPPIPLQFKKIHIKAERLPKFNTESAIPYHTKERNQSILSPTSDAEEPKDPTEEVLVRYSDNELEEFKALILQKLESAKAELLYARRMLSVEAKDNMERTHNMMEDGQINAERESLSQYARRQHVFIDHLEKALIRIENKTYGICRETGKLIDKDRLRAVPHATLSIEAKIKAIKK